MIPSFYWIEKAHILKPPKKQALLRMETEQGLFFGRRKDAFESCCLLYITPT